MKVITRFVLDSNLDVIEEESFEYRGPLAQCTGGEEVAAAEAGSKAAGDAAVATDAASIAGDVGLAAPEAATGGVGAGALGSGVAAIPEAFGTGFADLGAGGVGLAPSESALAAPEVGAPAVAAAAPPVAAGPATIAGSDAASMVGDVGLAPPEAMAAPAPDISGGAGLGFGGETALPESIGGAPPVPGASEFTGTTAAAKPTIGTKLLDQLTNNPLTAAALGLNATSAIMANKAGKDAASQLRGAAAPFTQEGQDLIAQYKSGKLNPADEFKINQWEQQQIAAAKSQYGGDSTAARRAVSEIEARAQSMRDQALSSLLDQGLKAMGMGVGPLTSAVQAQTQQDQALAQAQSGALNSLLLIQAMNRGAPAPAGTTG